MSTARRSLGGVTIGLVTLNIVSIAVIVVGMLMARRASEDGEDALVALVDDVTRASQAQATAERMIAVGRSYLLVHEPDLLARAQAAEAKLTRTMQTIATSAHPTEERTQLDAVVAAAMRYRRNFGALLSGEGAPRDPHEVADALRKQLIPARDELLSELDALVARRYGRLEALRSEARDRRARALQVMTTLGIAGIMGIGLLAWLLVIRVRAVAAMDPGAAAAPGRPPIGIRSSATQRLSRRIVSARTRP